MNKQETTRKDLCGIGGWAECIDCEGRLHRAGCKGKTAKDCKCKPVAA